MSRALEAAEKLIQVANFTCLVSGHDFSRAGKANKINVGLYRSLIEALFPQPVQPLQDCFINNRGAEVFSL
jgi:hypothetical protein